MFCRYNLFWCFLFMQNTKVSSSIECHFKFHFKFHAYLELGTVIFDSSQDDIRHNVRHSNWKNLFLLQINKQTNRQIDKQTKWPSQRAFLAHRLRIRRDQIGKKTQPFSVKLVKKKPIKWIIMLQIIKQVKCYISYTSFMAY